MTGLIRTDKIGLSLITILIQCLMKSDAGVPNGLILLEPGLNYFRICCYIKSLTVYKLNSNHADLVYSNRPISALVRDEIELDAGRNIQIIPLVSENGFSLYDWYSVCAHIDKALLEKVMIHEPSTSDNSSSTVCFTIRPCDCNCYSTSWLTIALSAKNDQNVTGLTARLLRHGHNTLPKYPGPVKLDIDLSDAGNLNQSTDKANLPFNQFSLTLEPPSRYLLALSLAASIPFSNTHPQLIRIKMNVTLSLIGRNRTIYSDFLDPEIFYKQGPIMFTDFDYIDWNRHDDRFWILQPIRLATPAIFSETPQSPHLKPLLPTEARQLCDKMQDTTVTHLSANGSPNCWSQSRHFPWTLLLVLLSLL